MRFIQPILYKNDGAAICENASTVNFKQSANVPHFNEQPRKKINIVGNNAPIKLHFWSFKLSLTNNLTPSYIVPFQTGTSPTLSYYAISGKRRYYFRFGGTLKNLNISAKELLSGSKTITTTVMIGSGAGNSNSTSLLTSLVINTTSYQQSFNTTDTVAILPYDWIEVRYGTSAGSFHDIATTGSIDFYPNFGA